MTLSRTTILASVLALTIPAVALAAPVWDNQNAQGSVGKVTQLGLYSPGYTAWATTHGAVQIGNASYSWGGTQCATDITNVQIDLLSMAMVQGLNVQPVYRSIVGSTTRCLVVVTVFKP